MAKNPAIILYDADGNPVSVIADSGVYRLAQFAKVQNVAGTVVNPATQDTLASIKDTDGIKKIVDALPTGDNAVGRVKITDGTDVVDVIDDAGTKRLQVDAKFTSATVSAQIEGRAADGMPPVGYPVLIGGQDGTNVQSVLTDTLGRIVTVSAGTPITNLVVDYLKDAGSSYQMKVNGSGTPKVYTYSADPTKDITLLELRFVYSAQAFAWSGNGFGKDAAGKLTNGILIELIVNNGVTVTLANIQINEDFLRTFGTVPVINTTVLGDVMTPAWLFTGGSSLILKAGTADKIRTTIRDNLTGGALGVNYLTATFFGTKAV